MAHAPLAKVLPSDLGAPAFVNAWRARALMIAVLFTVVAVVLAFLVQAVGVELFHAGGIRCRGELHQLVALVIGQGRFAEAEDARGFPIPSEFPEIW